MSDTDCKWRQFGKCLLPFFCKIDVHKKDFPKFSAVGDERREQGIAEDQTVAHAHECGSLAWNWWYCNTCGDHLLWSIRKIHDSANYDRLPMEKMLSVVKTKHITWHCPLRTDEWCEMIITKDMIPTTTTTTTTQIFERAEKAWECHQYVGRQDNEWCQRLNYQSGWDYELFPDVRDTPCGCPCCKKRRKGWKPVQKPKRNALDNTVHPSCVDGAKPIIGPTFNVYTPSYRIMASTAKPHMSWNIRNIDNARLDQDTVKSWCAAVNDHRQFIQVNFRQTMVITKILTLGRGDAWDQYVTSYKVVYKNLQGNWTAYRKILKGNVHGNVLRSNSIIPIAAKKIRLVPLTWNRAICMRIDFIGCNFYDIGLQYGLEGGAGLAGGMGPPGPQGLDGVIGDEGARGPPGEEGIKGKRGPRGPEGPHSSPMDCAWAQWIEWSVCSAGCGGGIQQRERGYEVYAQNQGKDCHGDSIQTKKCSRDPCTPETAPVQLTMSMPVIAVPPAPPKESGPPAFVILGCVAFAFLLAVAFVVSRSGGDEKAAAAAGDGLGQQDASAGHG